MFGRTGAVCVLAASALWLSGCGRVAKPDSSLSPEEKAAGVKLITLHVPGMIDRQGIT
jgi:hypothetical protein